MIDWWEEGYKVGKQGLVRVAPEDCPDEDTEFWYAGYDCATEIWGDHA